MSVLRLLAVLALGGCSIGGPSPDKTFYVFAASTLGPTSPVGVSAQTIRVARVRVAPPFDSRVLQYRVDGTRIEASYYHNWADDPGALLTVAISAALDSNDAVRIVDDSSNALATHTLEVVVKELAADVSGAQPLAVLSARATLLDANGAIVHVVDLHHSEPAVSAEAADVVQAMSAGLDVIVGDMTRDLISGGVTHAPGE